MSNFNFFPTQFYHHRLLEFPTKPKKILGPKVNPPSTSSPSTKFPSPNFRALNSKFSVKD